MGALSHEAKFKQDAKPRSDCFKKNKKENFKDVTRRDPWAPPLTKQNLIRTQNYEVFAA